jgi:FG-GAP repeat
MTHLLHSACGLRARPLLPLLFAAFTLAGCGGGDGDPGNDPPPSSVVTLAVQDIKTLRLNWSDTDQETSYRLLVQSEASAVRTVVATLPANTTQHDLQVFLPEQVNARYTLQACTSSGCLDAGSADVQAALLNSAVGYFKAALPGSQMGKSVALSADGSTLAVGAPDDDSQLTDSGAVYLFTRSPGGWVAQAVLQAAIPGMGDYFGEALALSSDGQHLAVGASGHAQSRGAVYVFERVNGLWAQRWFQTDPLPWTAQDNPREFGWALALSGDGRTLVAGRMDGDYTAFVYARDNGSWTAQAAIPANGARDATAFALSDDGDTLVVARRDAATVVGTSGVVDVYQRTLGNWQGRTAQLTASNAGDGDGFGWSVAIAGDGQTIAVGAIFEDSGATGINGLDGNGGLNSGAVYVFARSGNTWSQEAYIKASNTGEFDWFGYAVSLSTDGNALAVTANDEDSSAQGLSGPQDNNAVNASGAAYVFRRHGGAWGQSGFVKAPNAGEFDRFGDSIALSGDGRTLAVGTVSEDSAATGIGGDQNDNSVGRSGAVYLY